MQGNEIGVNYQVDLWLNHQAKVLFSTILYFMKYVTLQFKKKKEKEKRKKKERKKKPTLHLFCVYYNILA